MKSLVEKINESIDELKSQSEELYKQYMHYKLTGNKMLARKYKTKLDQISGKIDKEEYGASEVIKILKKLGYSPAKSSSTRIRGFKNYTKGYEYSASYSTYIHFHAFNDSDIDKISTALKDHPNVESVSKSGISLKKKK